MNDGGDDMRSFGHRLWKAQPRWVNVLTLLVGFPAWLALMAAVFTGRTEGLLPDVAFGAMAGVGVLQLVFIARAFWRMDL